MKKCKKPFILIGVLILIALAIIVLTLNKNYNFDGNLKSNSTYYEYLEK